MNFKITPLTDPDYRAFSRRIAWLASDADGAPVGSAFLRLNSKPTQAHLAELELAVHPAERRKGIGSRLLAAAIDAARENDARTVLADATAESPGDRFLAHHGFVIGLTLIFTRLPLADAQYAVLAEILGAAAAGYRLESWQGVPPDHLIASFTEARAAMNDAPVGDISYGAETWDLERTRSVANVVEQRGELLETVAAVEESTGKVAGFTELVVPGDGKGDAQHYGTAVLAGHRGHGLALWMKAAQVRQIRERYPDLAGLLTDMAATNLAMQRVNTRLGYVTTHRTHRYALDQPGESVQDQ